jgi:hypothetical protein
METDTFTCAICKGTFNKIRSDEEVAAEYKERFPEAHVAVEEHIVVCEDCFRDVTGGMFDD